MPILALQNYGGGRSAAFTSGGSWYWRVSRPASDEFHERVWKQLIRWLVVGAREQLSIETDADTYAQEKQGNTQAETNSQENRLQADSQTDIASYQSSDTVPNPKRSEVRL